MALLLYGNELYQLFPIFQQPNVIVANSVKMLHLVTTFYKKFYKANRMLYNISIITN